MVNFRLVLKKSGNAFGSFGCTGEARAGSESIICVRNRPSVSDRPSSLVVGVLASAPTPAPTTFRAAPRARSPAFVQHVYATDPTT